METSRCWKSCRGRLNDGGRWYYNKSNSQLHAPSTICDWLHSLQSKSILHEGQLSKGIIQGPHKYPPQNFPLQPIPRRRESHLTGAARGHMTISELGIGSPHGYRRWGMCNLSWLQFVIVELVPLGQQPADFQPPLIITFFSLQSFWKRTCLNKSTSIMCYFLIT